MVHANEQYAGYQEDQVLASIEGVMGGLVTQMERDPTVGLQSGYAKTGRNPGDCETAVVPTHCLRSVSQRSLDEPVTFLSDPQTIAAAADIFDALVTSASGALPGTGPGGAPIVFNSANIQAQRQRIDDLVLIGMRAKVSVQAQAGTGGPGTPFNYGEYVDSIRDFVRDYVVFRIFHTADDNEPWVDSTSLRYIDRPEGEFIPVPPVLWKDRDPRMEIDVRVADFGAAAGSLPTLAVSNNAIDAQLSILVEALWIPNPDYCGAFWPGEMCPKTIVANHKAYKGR